MNRFYLLPICIFIVWLMPSISLAQNAACDGTRFIDEVFATTTKTTVKFGENTSNGGNFKELYMDIYEPDGDAAVKRPAIVVAFGGSFIFGSRATLAGLCEYYAKRGYVAATIDYRLFDAPIFPIPDSIAMMEEVIMAISDMKAAIRFLRKDAATSNQFRIDPDFVFAGGESAGSIVANHVAYVSDTLEYPPFISAEVNAQGGLEGNTDDPANSNMGYSSEVQGVLNLYGALYTSDFLDAGDPPITSIHGTNDDVVPYGYGWATVSGFNIIHMSGSSSIHKRADLEGVDNHLITVPNGGHGTFMSNSMWSDSIYTMASIMMEELVCDGFSSINQISVDRQVVVFPNPTSSELHIAFNGLNEKYQVELIDQLGRKVIAVSGLSDDEFILSKQDVPAVGMYQLYVSFENGELAPVVRNVVFH